MRKKSHIKLVSVLFEQIGDNNINKYKLWLEIGSILPDVVPTFIWKRHRIDTTESTLRKTVNKFINGKECGRLNSLRAGVITHYLSDYFTFPHNKECKMSFLKHNSYEGRQLKEFSKLSLDEFSNFTYNLSNIHNIDDLFSEIDKLHDEYLSKVESSMDVLSIDMKYIAFVSYYIMSVLTQKRMELSAIPI